jgi:hypothetical protein
MNHMSEWLSAQKVASTPTSVRADRAGRRSSDQSSFDGLLTQVQSGFGRAKSATPPAVNDGRGLKPEEAPSARQQRVEELDRRAKEDAGPTRAQRLAEVQDGDSRSNELGEFIPPPAAQPVEVGERAKAAPAGSTLDNGNATKQFGPVLSGHRTAVPASYAVQAPSQAEAPHHAGMPSGARPVEPAPRAAHDHAPPVQAQPAQPAVAATLGEERSSPAAETVANRVARVLANDIRSTTPKAQPAPDALPAGRTAGRPGQENSARQTRSDSSRTPGEPPKSDRTGEPTRRSDFQQLVEAIKFRSGPNRSTARIRLDPPELGWVRVEARMTGSDVELFVRAERPESARLLSERVHRLETAMEQHGISIGKFELVDESQSPRDLQPGLSWNSQSGFGQDQAPPREPVDDHRTGLRDRAAEQLEPAMEDEPAVAANQAGTARLDLRI